MNTRLLKAWKDLTERKSRSLLTLAGLAIGMWGIATVAIAWVVLSNDLSENFLRTLPPHLMIGPADDQPLTLSEIEGVEAWENRPLLTGRIEAAPDFFIPLNLFIVDDFEEIKVARFFPEEGVFPPAEGEMLIERSGEIILKIMAAQVSNPNPAADRHRVVLPADDGEPDTLSIQLPGGSTQRVTISGTVFDPGLAPSSQERIIYGYVTRTTAERWLEDIPDRFLVRISDSTTAEAVIQNVGTRAEFARNLTPLGHPHQFQMDSILWLLSGLGVLAFGMGAVLVVNLVNAILNNQIRQIGALKAIGATERQVTQGYLVSQLILGVFSGIIALPFAVKSAYAVCSIISAMLNFDILTTQVSWKIYLTLMVVAVLFPVLAAWFPVRRWSGVAIRDALEHQGTRSQYFKTSAIDRVQLPLPVSVRAGVRNALRRPGRFALSALTIAIGALVFLMAMNMRSSIVNTAATEESTVLYDVSINFEEVARLEQIDWMLQFPAVTDLELWPASRASIDNAAENSPFGVTVVGVPAETWAIKPNLIEGNWISDSEPLGVVATHRLMNELPGLRVGDIIPLVIEERTIEVKLVGVEKRFGPGYLKIPLNGFLQVTNTQPDTGRIAMLQLTDEVAANPADFIRLLEAHFGPGLPVVRQVTTSRMAARIIRNHLDVIVATISFLAAIILVISGLGLASGISTSVVERTRELGVLRALGAKPGAVYRLLSVESLMVGLGGFLLALIFADPLSRRLEYYLGNGIVEYPFDHLFSLEGVGICLATIVVMALLATIGPARMITRHPVRHSISYE